MYAVVEGVVELSRNGTAIETVGEGNIFGELALVDDHSRGATATAATAARLAPVDKARFTFLVQEHPTFALQVMAVMAERIRNANHALSHAVRRACTLALGACPLTGACATCVRLLGAAAHAGALRRVSTTLIATLRDASSIISSPNITAPLRSPSVVAFS